MRLNNRRIALFPTAAVALTLASCIPSASSQAPASTAGTAKRTIPVGPQADYPVVIGEPFTIDGITYTPSDTLNYDEVGYAAVDDDLGAGITAAHRTLPLPSYIEVTSLQSGRTVLVRVEQRGPMTNSRMIALSPDALAQLAIGEGDPVRVRRVNPPEEERAELRADRQVTERMDTPPGLLTVLRKKLPAVGSASLGRSADAEAPEPQEGGEAIETVEPDTDGLQQALPRDDEVTVNRGNVASEPAAQPATDRNGKFVVQAGAYSTRAAADRVANSIEGYVEPVGRLWRVRSGPYSTRGQAEAALAKVRGAGYTDAQIFTRK